jgi:hypothetical protein
MPTPANADRRTRGLRASFSRFYATFAKELIQLGATASPSQP